MGMPLNNLIGQKFGHLFVMEQAESQKGKGGARWLCLCDCGRKTISRGSDLIRNKSRSCGCKRYKYISDINKTHGKSKTRTYKLWIAMKNRCNFNHPNYGGRGISYDPRWERFENFLEDMGEAPDERSLDRIDVNGNYEKGNCRWATQEQQHNNTRSNVFIEWNGKRQTRTQWERELGMKPTTLRTRLRNWTLEEAMTRPLAWVAEGNTAEEWTNE